MNLNIFYVILNILFLMVASIYFKDEIITMKQRVILFGIYLFFTLVSGNYFNGIMNRIFELQQFIPAFVNFTVYRNHR